MKVRRIAYALGAEVTGIDLRSDLSDEQIAAIRNAWLEHSLLCFPEQPFEPEQMLAFAGRFGPRETISKDNAHPDYPNLSFLTEKVRYGKPWDGFKNGQDWHSDQSYAPNPTVATFVSCKEIPEAGGDTMFANMYRAYEALSPGARALAESLSAIHHRTLLRPFAGNDHRNASVAADRDARNVPTVHPVVKVHPETGRRSLFLGSRARAIFGLTDEESKAVLDLLNAGTAAPEIVYRHKWRVGDLVMWDNRCLLHIALCDYDLAHDPRLMMRTAVTGPVVGRPLTEAREAKPSLV